MITVALSSWSLHTLFLNPESSGLKGTDFPRIARQNFGVQYVEFYEGDYAPDLMEPGFRDEEHARAVFDECQRHGVRVVCLSAVNDLVAANLDARERDRRRIIRLARHCIVLGCPVLRINSGRHPLDVDRAEILASELRRLADDISDLKVCLAVENHPHLLDSDMATDLLIGVVTAANRPNVRLCPDVGAMGPGYWRNGLARMAPLAAHVHLKPYVLEGSPGVIGSARALADYVQEARTILEKANFDGAVALEGLPSLDLEARPYEESLELLGTAASAFGTRLEAPSRLLFPPVLARSLATNHEKELVPSLPVLQLLADGCERRLGAHIRVLDLATEEVVLSQSAAHRASGHEQTAGEPPHFCELVDSDPIASLQCSRFYQHKISLFRDGGQVQARTCICPMGLMIHSVPIRDETHVYGVISCGPWVEQGTEGMIIDGIFRHADPVLRPALDEAALRIPDYSPGRLLTTQGVVGELAKDLAGIYKERLEQSQARRYLGQGSRIFLKLQESRIDSQPELESFLTTTLEGAFREFEDVAGFGHLVLYRRHAAPSGSDVIRLQSPQLGVPGLPVAVTVTTSHDAQPPDGDKVRAELVHHILKSTPYDCLEPDRKGGREFVLFCYPKGTVLSTHFRSFFSRFVTEVHYVLANLRNLTEAEARRKELVLFTSRFQHAISSPLQGVSDCVLQFRRYLNGRKTMSFKELGELVRDLSEYTTDSNSILKRFTWLVNVTGQQTSLRPRYSFSTVNMTIILEESIRKWKRAAEHRQVRIKGPDSDREIYQEGDRNALVEVFDNLVENAAKFANDGSVITVEILEPDDRMAPPWLLSGPGRRFVVRNQGPGVAPDEQEEIFKPFVQGRIPLSSRVIRGTGVGLAICREIVTAHEGTIKAQSRPSSGIDHRTSLDDLQNCIFEVLVDLPIKLAHAEAAAPTGGT